MASSSPASDSQYCPTWKYDVFLSFRGADTRRTFTGHLYEGLKNRGIFTFQDDKRLEHGDSIPEELLKAIEESQVALVIFSKNYATSRWCLNELVKIMECKVKNGQKVIPVFYDVYASEVRKQTKSFGEAFTKHESKYKNDIEGMQKVKGWRAALSDAADLKGCNIHDRIESDCIRELVDDVSSKLCKTSLSYLQDIVGIDTHLEKVKSLLKMEMNDVRIVWIWGIGGVGKTTIAKAIFGTLSYQFKAACFLADVKENKEMHTLQNILLSELLRKEEKYVHNKEDGKHMMARRLRSMKVLIVLDDIDHGDQLESLAGDVCWFGYGSRIVVTTRDRHLIEKNDAIYEVSTLSDHEAMQLFNKHAFKKEVPDESFKKLSLEVVNYAKGLPLALKVWGSLFHNKGLTQWRRTVDQIKKNSNSEIVKKLKISYDGLEPEEQEIFLDIACFFRGHVREFVMQILGSCYFGAEYGLDVLIDKSLVFIAKYDQIEMHDLIEDMGKYIVKMQKDSRKHSRIWNVEDFKDVMVDTTGSIMEVEAICIPKLCFIRREAMQNMKKLRMFYSTGFPSYSEDNPIEYLPNNLCCIVWYHYPGQYLPENFNFRKLVHLDLHGSSLHHLWNETKQLPSLRGLNLNGSKSLERTPDFTGMPNLEYLDLRFCTSLEEVHDSLECSKKLIELSLYECKRLKRFPSVNVESLKSLSLQNCSSLEEFPEFLGTMKPELVIRMSYSGIRELPLSIIHLLSHLTVLDLSGMKNLVSLPSSICKFKGLVELHVSHCSKLESLPEEIGDLEKLEELHARDTLISQPPSSIVRLNKLVNLDLSNCNLKDGVLPEDIGSLSSLEKLILGGNNFKHLPRSISQLSGLQSLYLSNCKRLKELPDFTGMPNLEKLHARYTQISRPPSSIVRLNKLVNLDLSNCNLIDGGLPEDIGSLSSLKMLYLEGNNFEHLPRSISQLSGLQSLYLSNCKRLKELPDFMGMPNLETLDLSSCNLIDGGLPEDIGCLSSLKELSLKGNNFEHLPRSISHLSALKSLDLSDCKRLTQLPELPQQLEIINVDWSNDSICNSLFQNISSLQHDISAASDSLSLRVFKSWEKNIPSWFHHRGRDVSVNLPENWDKLLGFAVCYAGWRIFDMITAHLIPLCDDGMSSMTRKLALSNHSEPPYQYNIYFFLVPIAVLWDASNANGKTPNDYGCIRLYFLGKVKEFGVRLFYKDEAEEQI